MSRARAANSWCRSPRRTRSGIPVSKNASMRDRSSAVLAGVSQSARERLATYASEAGPVIGPGTTVRDAAPTPASATGSLSSSLPSGPHPSAALRLWEIHERAILDFQPAEFLEQLLPDDRRRSVSSACGVDQTVALVVSEDERVERLRPTAHADRAGDGRSWCRRSRVRGRDRAWRPGWPVAYVVRRRSGGRAPNSHPASARARVSAARTSPCGHGMGRSRRKRTAPIRPKPVHS
jgi:hypothetical protein